jgi:hypothetical protein
VTVSAPGAGNNGYYFREGQAVGVATDAATALGNTATWETGPGTLTFDIANIFGPDLVDDLFTLAWEMTCANDVILATVDTPHQSIDPTRFRQRCLCLQWRGFGRVALLTAEEVRGRHRPIQIVVT